jgi:5'-nucleotidase
MKDQPELVVSGINLGPNLGDDVHYSGTVAGAMEGILNGIPSVAFSLVTHSDPLWEAAAKFCGEFAGTVATLELPRDTFVNVNIPNLPISEIRGVRVTSQGSRRYKGDLIRYEAPIVGEYYWRGGEVIDRAERNDADVVVVKEGYISVTPLGVDLTQMQAMQTIKQVMNWE